MSIKPGYDQFRRLQNNSVLGSVTKLYCLGIDSYEIIRNVAI